MGYYAVPGQGGANRMDDRRSLVLLQPRGFCAGVERAVDGVWRALEELGPPIYVRHDIVHNEHVLSDLRAAGAVFVEDLADVPRGSRVFLSAHGVSPAVRADAARRGLTTIDATCPLVAKVHNEAIRLARDGFTILLVGHRDHAEVVGTRGEAEGATIVVSNVTEAEIVQPPDPGRVAYLTQTTLSLDDVAEIVATLRRRFPAIREPASQDICYASTNRQAAVRVAAPRVEVLLVVGSRASSNSNSLVETARRVGVQAMLVSGPATIPWGDLAAVRDVALTSGASTPESVFAAVVDALTAGGFQNQTELRVLDEDVRFRRLEPAPSATHVGRGLPRAPRR
jgi:4-hydroxy-3-methylbut-2-enyl diphosphate reductase